MKNRLALLIGIIVFAVLVAYMFTFQVRYDEVAVRTFFGSAVEPTFDPQGNMVDSGSLYFEPGLKWKMPWPVHQVRTFPRKLHLLEDELEQVQLADQHTVIIRTHLTWRIAQPYRFFQEVGTVQNAETQLRRMMAPLRGVINSYRFDELVNDDPDALRFEEAERECLARLRAALEEMDPGYGIEVVDFGIRRILLPEAVSEDVFARMRATRERMAEDILARGRSEAASIRNEAESTREIILDFASRRAEQIRAEGDAEAARYYEAFAEHQDLAIFLAEIEALQEMLAHHTTFILDAHQLAVLKPFVRPRGADPEGDAVEARQDGRGSQPTNEAGAVVPAELTAEQWEAFQQFQQLQRRLDAPQLRSETDGDMDAEPAAARDDAPAGTVTQ